MLKDRIEIHQFKKEPKNSQPALIFKIGYFDHELMTNPMATKKKIQVSLQTPRSQAYDQDNLIKRKGMKDQFSVNQILKDEIEISQVLNL